MNASQVLGSRYRLERLLGSGGMSEVWLAEDTRLSRWVAVKVLRPGDDEALAEAVGREARLLARLHHTNIAAVYDAGTEDGSSYLVMEYVHGLSLREILESRGQLPEQEAIHYGAQVADALQYAHDNGIVHADVKPENILVTEDGVAKVVDFGISGTIGQTLAPAAAQELLGTLAYLAPEVLQGAAPNHRADTYALGLTVYELLAGRLPFAGSTPAAIAGQRLAAAAPPLRTFVPSASAALEAVLAKATAQAPAARQSSSGELGRELRAAVRGMATTQVATPVVRQPAPSPLRRHETARIVAPMARAGGPSVGLIAAVAAILLAAGGLTVFAVILIRSTDDGGAATTTPTAVATTTTAPATSPTPTRTAPAATATQRPTETPTPTPTPASPTTAPTTATAATPTRTPTAPAATPTQRPPSPSPSQPTATPQNIAPQPTATPR